MSVEAKHTYTVYVSFGRNETNSQSFNKSISDGFWFRKYVWLIHDCTNCLGRFGDQDIPRAKEYSIEATLCIWDQYLPSFETESPWLNYEWDQVSEEKASTLNNVSRVYFT
jgi:hypothetical protein